MGEGHEFMVLLIFRTFISLVITFIFVTISCCLEVLYLLSDHLSEVTREVTQISMSGENSNRERRIYIRDNSTGKE